MSIVKRSIRHISTSIDGLLELSDYRLKKILDCCTYDDGTQPTLKEFKDFLKAEKELGHKLIPSPGCDNFDPVYGCLGHPVKDGANE